MAGKTGRAIAAKQKAKVKAPARTKSPKPPAKKSRSKRRPGQKVPSAWRRNVADRWVIHWRVFEGLPWKDITAKDGRQERTLRRVVDDYLKNVEEGDAVKPLERDPLDIIEGMVNELGIMRDTMQMLVAGSEDEKTVVAGVREWRRLVKEVRELLQGIGKLPRELGTLRHLVEVRDLSDRLDGWLERLEEGKMSPQELRANVAEWAGVKQIEPAADDGSGEPVDAEIVPDASGVTASRGNG